MRWLAKGKSKLFREKTGFTLIEIVIALGILAAVGTGFLTALNTNSRAVRTVDEQVTAANLATTYFEAISMNTYADTYPNAGDNITVPFQYSVNVDIQFSSESIKEGDITQIIGVDEYLDGEGKERTLQKITITISREGGKPVLATCTFKTKKVVSES